VFDFDGLLFALLWELDGILCEVMVDFLGGCWFVVYVWKV